jgi:NAD(P)-dependent dehydrogenase (short-subunit alcohol dehydrogenase family)
MKRTYVVTGSASGIGLATRKKLEALGHKVIGIDIHDAEVVADLSNKEGRKTAAEKTLALSEGAIDSVIANAGSGKSESKTVSINYFGAVELINHLLPALKKSGAPRVVATSSMASLMKVDKELVEDMLAGEENKALARAEALVKQGGGAEGMIYSSTKRALSRWIRRECIKDEWAKSGIPMNAVGPGIVKTPMVAEMIATKEGRDGLAKVVPMPLHGYLEPDSVADLIIWLASEVNSHVTGQTIYIDGGSDAVLRGDDVWSQISKS